MTPNSAMVGHYDPPFVVISVVIAIMSAYAALDLAGRVSSSRSAYVRTGWLAGGATVMGIGIWSMHYIGMLAFRMPMTVLYDWPTVLLSMVAGIAASGIALYVATRRTMGFGATVLGSVTMGGGIASMHYIGMDAMRMSCTRTYSQPLVVLSIVLAIVIACVALRITFATRNAPAGWTWQKGLSALLMGVAIPVMHYTGMAAASWTPSASAAPNLTHAIAISDLGAACIALVSIVMLCLVFLAAIIDRRFSDRARDLEGSEERYRHVISSAFDAYIGYTSEGRITDWNAQANATFGWTEEEAIGLSISDMILPGPGNGQSRNSSGTDGGDTHVVKEGRTERQARHKTGLVFPVEIAVSAIRWGDQSYFAAFVHDVTDRKAAEQHMQEARASAEEANRAKSEFLANMSHEIRTPLNGVIGMTDLALETELTREQREYIETVKLSADSLLGVINDILDFSKIEAGKIELETTAFDLSECVESTLKTLALRADEKGLELLCDIDAETPEFISGDPGRLRQILTNLIGNAIKFTDEGEISIRVSTAGTKEPSVLHFTVSDTGIGIARGKLERIFESFNQADTSTTRQYGGTGLGLTISKRLIELMGGHIWVESEIGKGSQFHFRLPFQEAERKPQSMIRPTVEALTGVRVLIIDDSKTNRRILEGLLTRWGMKPVSAPDGESALGILREANSSGAPFQLILTDMHMPKMDGFMLVEELHRGSSSTATVMMLSSGGHRGDADRCQELGIAAYLLKPVRQNELQEAIARALGATPARRESMITHATLQAERPQGEFLDILLAEDNEVNQKLAVRLLEKRGHSVTVVGNGRRAVQAVDSRAFDLVLMDVQMPEMDGIEATAAIRQHEKITGLHQPIVAMTALVMKGDRERCLAGEMDGYLSKPIRPKELDELLDIYILRKRTSLQQETDSTPQRETAVDASDLMERVDGDLVFIAELTDVLREDCPRKFAALQSALEENDLLRVKGAAHGLKGAFANVSAVRAAGLAAQIERLSANSELVELPSILSKLQVECAEAIEALDALSMERAR